MNSHTNLTSQFSHIQNFSSIVIIKYTQSVFQNVSNGAANFLGWKSAEQVLGKTDYDIPCHAVELADKFQKMDKKVIATTHKIITLEIASYRNGWGAMLVEKTPLINDSGKLEGVYCHAIDVSDTYLFKYGQILNYADQKIISSTQQAACYIINPEHSPLPLTMRQQQCVFFLVRGKIAKQIADILDLAPGTVNDYIADIKHKLDCNSKSELIEKAIDAGFLYYIPESLLKDTKTRNLNYLLEG